MSWNEHHSRSERLAADAAVALKSGNREDGERLYAEAAAAEIAALGALAPGKPKTLGITAVSAVALWYKARRFHEADSTAYRALGSMALPSFAIGQLQHLLQMSWTAAAAAASGRRFVPGDVLVSVQGGIVVPGGAPLDLIKQKVEGVQAILFRVVEMLLNRPLRRRGSPPLDIQEAFRPWLFHAPAGSYQFAVRIEEPKQLNFFGPPFNIDAVTSTFFDVLRASATDPDRALAELVPNDDYREAFLSLSRSLAPTGKTFSRLEISDASSPAAEPVTLETDSRQSLNAALKKLKPPQPVASTEEVVEIRGVLRGLQLDKDWLEVATDDGDPLRPTRILQANDVLDDVVGPMVNHRVVVTAIRRNARLTFRDIELEE